MTRNNQSKLNQMILSMPRGAIITSEWLHHHNISSKLAWSYVKSNWLEKIADKAFKHPSDLISWVGIVYALQNQLNKPIHVSGKSALALTGKAHYLPINNIIELFTESKVSLPSWFDNDNIAKKNNIIVHHKQLLNIDSAKYLIKKEFEGLNILLSCNELAILEVLELVPKKQDFIEAAHLMEGLPYLRSNVVQQLLEHCSSIKAKRLFLYLATKFNHPWLKKIDITKINLGSGKRSIMNGGYYDNQFQIVVPTIGE